MGLLIVAAACGGGDATTTTVPSGSATTVATTTTTAGSTGGGLDDADWDAVWPADGATAVYQVVPFPGETVEVDARIEYGVDFRGETLDRIVFGSGTGGERGLVVYFDRSTPWVFSIVAAEVYATNVDDGPSYTERFDTPMPFNAGSATDDMVEFDGLLLSEDSDGSVDELPIGYRVTTVSDDASIDVPYGTVDGTVHLGVQVGFPEVGDFDFVAELWLDPELLLVRMTGSPSWNDIQLVTPFS